MKETRENYKYTMLSKIILLLSTLAFIFWYLSQVKNVYRSAFGNSVLDILWLPMQVLLLGLPMFSLFMYGRERFRLQSLYLYSFLLMVGIILYLLLD